MPIYTLTSADRAILAFSAKDRVDALGFAANGFIRSELASLNTPEGQPLWDGQQDLMVREVTPSERAVWEADLPRAIRDGVAASREQAFSNGHFIFLVDYREPNE